MSVCRFGAVIGLSLFGAAGIKSTLAVLADTPWMPIDANAILTRLGLFWCA